MIIRQRRLLTWGAGWVRHPGERRWRTQAKLELGHCNIPSRERRQTGKKADHIGGANRKAPQSGADQSSVPRGQRWQSQPLPPNIKGPMVRGPRHMTEIKRLGSAPAPFKHRKTLVRSVSPHVDRRAAIRSFLREARRAKPLMSWRRPQKVSEAEARQTRACARSGVARIRVASALAPCLRFPNSYILSIERQLLRKAFILSLKKSARERPMDREKVAEVLLDLMEEGRIENKTFHLLLS